MYIKKLTIQAFGVLRNREITLSPALNIIEGENESGKSALAMFIKFMLYGLSGRASGGELSERRRYVNWDTGTAAGSMLLSENGREIRIERNLSVSSVEDGEKIRESVRESVRILDAETNALLHRGEVPGEALLGVPENVFMNTVFVRQIDGTRPAGTGVLSSIENLLFSADENVGTQKALDRLEEGRRQILHRSENGGELYELRQERSRTAAQLAQASDAGGDLMQTQAQLSQADGVCAELDEKIRRQETIIACGEVNLLKRRFDSLAAASRKQKDLQQELDALQGRDLDRAYLAQLGQSVSRLNEYCQAAETLTAADAAMDEKVKEATKKADELDSETEYVLTDAERMLSRMRSTAAAAATLFFFAVLLGAGGWFLYMVHVSLYPVPLMGAGVLAILGMICLLVRKRTSSRLQELLQEWNAVNTAALADAVAKAMGGRVDVNALRAEKRQLENALTDMLSRRREEAHSLLELSQKAVQVDTEPIQNEGDDVLVETAFRAASAAQEEAEKHCSAAEALQHEADTWAGRLHLLREQLADAREEEVRRTFAENMNTVEGRIASGLDAARLDAAKKELDALLARRREAVEAHHKLDTQLAAAKAVQESPTVLAEKLSLLDQQIEKKSEEHAAYCLAIETMTRASERVRAGILPRIVQDACAAVNRLSDGKFEAVGIDHGLQMSFTRGGQTRGVEYLSEGTKDLAYVSLRRALCRALFGDNCPPLIYDESFARIDESRLGRILTMLSDVQGDDCQSIVLSCRRLEAELVTENGGARIIRL